MRTYVLIGSYGVLSQRCLSIPATPCHLSFALIYRKRRFVGLQRSNLPTLPDYFIFWILVTCAWRVKFFIVSFYSNTSPFVGLCVLNIFLSNAPSVFSLFLLSTLIYEAYSSTKALSVFEDALLLLRFYKSLIAVWTEFSL